MAIDAPCVPPEFSRIVSLDLIDLANPFTEIQAKPDECTALARRFGLFRLDAFTATVAFEVSSPTRVIVTANYVAEVVQACVVTLEPVSTRIKDCFERRFVSGPVSRTDDVAVDPLADDPPEPWDGGAIDIGEVLAEQLGLAIDPYPRTPGAVFMDPPDQECDAGAAFSTLVALKDR